MNGLTIVFAGTPEFGIPCLDALKQSPHQLKAIYTQPDRPAGRGQKLQSSAVKQWALTHFVPVYQPVNFKSSEVIAELAALNPDVFIVIAYGLILPRAILEIPRFGCINVHASLLPRFRGAAPIQHALLHGDEYSGITIMQMDNGMDTGAMLATAQCSVLPTDNAQSLHDKLALLAPQPLLVTLEHLMQQKAKPQAQDNESATYAGKINKEDALINWDHSALKIDRLIRAFNPWPIAYCPIDNDILRIYEAQIITRITSDKPGTIVSIDKNGVLVATGKDYLLIKKIQFSGGKAIAVADWLNSGKKQLHVGLVL